MEINLKKKTLPIKDQIPKEFHEFLDVFSEEKAARFPEPRRWDHKIEMKDTFIPKSSTLPSPTYSARIHAESEWIPGGMVGMVGIW